MYDGRLSLLQKSDEIHRFVVLDATGQGYAPYVRHTKSPYGFEKHLGGHLAFHRHMARINISHALPQDNYVSSNLSPNILAFFGKIVLQEARLISKVTRPPDSGQTCRRNTSSVVCYDGRECRDREDRIANGASLPAC